MCKTTTAIESLSADAHCVISFDSEITLIKTGPETYHRKLPKVPIPSPPYICADAHCVISFDSEITLIKTGPETYHRKLPKVPIPSPPYICMTPTHDIQ